MNINKVEVGKRIFAIRKSMGLTMKEFGELMGDPAASDSIVSRWEKGVSIPNNERLKRIAELGGITTDDLLLGDSDKEKLIINQVENHISDFPFTNSEKEFLNNIKEELIPLILQRVRDYKSEVPSLGHWFLYVDDRLENLADIHSSAFSISVFDISFEKLNLPKIKEDLEYFYSNITSLDQKTLNKELNKTKQNKRNYIAIELNNLLESDQDHNINKLAFEDTVNCFNQIDISIDEMDFMTVYMQNLYYYEDQNGYRINSKESYAKFLEERIDVLENKLKEKNLSLIDKSTFEMVLKIDKATLKEIK